MKPGVKKALFAMVVLTVLAGCSNTIGTGSRTERGPVGVGPSIKELKGTPCACTEIPMKIPADMLGAA